MREYKSIGIDFTLIVIWIISLYIVSKEFKDFEIIKENLYYALFSIVVVLIFSVNIIKVNREGIIKELYLVNFKIKSRTWREIKCYAEVDEIYDGEHGKSTTKAIWFIDYNDKVSLRITKDLRHNFEQVLEIVDKFEDKTNQKIEVSNPYFMRRGWTKASEYFTLRNNEE